MNTNRNHHAPYVIRALIRFTIGGALIVAGLRYREKTKGWTTDGWYTGIWEKGLNAFFWAMIIVGAALMLIVIFNTIYLYAKYRQSLPPKEIRYWRQHGEVA